MINDFLYELIPGTKNFYWYEALYQKQWNIFAVPSSKIQKNIINIAKKAQLVRGILGQPMLVTSWLRVPAYNELINGATNSWHMQGGGLDFMCPNLRADAVRKQLRPHLAKLGLRMENLPGSNWVHIDNKKTKGARFFRP